MVSASVSHAKVIFSFSMGVKRVNKTQKKVNAILCFLIIILGCYIMVKGFLVFGADTINFNKEKLLDNILKGIDNYALETYMPSLSYPLQSERNVKSLEEYITELVFESVPIYAYLKNTPEYITKVENISTTQKIVSAMNEMEGEAQGLVGGEAEVIEIEVEQVIAETEATQVVSGNPESIFPKVTNISMEKLADFDYLIKSFYIVDSMTTITSAELNAQELAIKDLSITVDNSVPQILIYHSHSQEAFIDSVPGDPSTSIVGVGAYLTKLLREQYGYNVIHDTGVYDLVDGVLDRSYAYNLAGEAVEQILAENPTIEVVIDLHRDGTSQKVVTEWNGKPTAQVMFFNGLSKSARNGEIDYLQNPYIQENLAFSFQMQVKSEEYFPTLSRGIYLRGLRYNMHYKPRTLLLESGSQLNTVEEQLNAMEPVAELLDQVLRGR